MVEALLLGLVAFIAQSEYALGTSLISRPIVTGLLTGLVLGDVQTYCHYGRDAGAGVYRLFLRWRLDPARRRDRMVFSAWRSPLPLAQAQKRRCCLACLSPR